MKNKYIMVEVEGLPTPIIFPGYINHSDMVRMMGLTREHVLSAGFVQFSDDGIVPYGESISLGVISRPEDKAILATSFD